MTRDLILGFVAALELPEGEKARLLAMTPGSYTGVGAQLAAKIRI
jgi:adenylosuccinate lyase